MDLKKIMVIFLSLFVIIIWGLTIHRFFIIKNSGKKEVVNPAPFNEQTSTQILMEKIKMLTIEFDFRLISNPFQILITQDLNAKGIRIRQNGTSKKINSPPYMLQGIVWDENNPKAILVKTYKLNDVDKTDEVGTTIIITPGQTIDYGKVAEITRDWVIIHSQDAKFKLWSNRWEKVE